MAKTARKTTGTTRRGATRKGQKGMPFKVTTPMVLAVLAAVTILCLAAGVTWLALALGAGLVTYVKMSRRPAPKKTARPARKARKAPAKRRNARCSGCDPWAHDHR